MAVDRIHLQDGKYQECKINTVLTPEEKKKTKGNTDENGGKGTDRSWVP